MNGYSQISLRNSQRLQPVLTAESCGHLNLPSIAEDGSRFPLPRGVGGRSAAREIRLFPLALGQQLVFLEGLILSSQSFLWMCMQVA